LADWESALKRFVKVMPVDYKRMQTYMDTARSTGEFETEYDVAVAAFDMHLENLAVSGSASKKPKQVINKQFKVEQVSQAVR